MAPGSDFPPPVRRVEIPKSSGGSDLGAFRRSRTASHRWWSSNISSRVWRRSSILTPTGIAGEIAHQAVEQARKRGWSDDWVLDRDIKSFFATIDHGLLMRALRKQCQLDWVPLYVERGLTAAVQLPDGTLEARTRGTPQGGVASPLSTLYESSSPPISASVNGLQLFLFNRVSQLANSSEVVVRLGDRARMRMPTKALLPHSPLDPADGVAELSSDTHVVVLALCDMQNFFLLVPQRRQPPKRIEEEAVIRLRETAFIQGHRVMKWIAEILRIRTVVDTVGIRHSNKPETLPKPLQCIARVLESWPGQDRCLKGIGCRFGFRQAQLPCDM